MITTHIVNQDFVAWTGQGRIADRTKESLGSSDRGVILMRKRFLQDLARIERGEDPSALIRDPAANQCIPLPIVSREMLVEGLPLAEMLEDPGLDPRLGYVNQYGQPDRVRAAYRDAMGLDANDDVASNGSSFLVAAGSAKNNRQVWL